MREKEIDPIYFELAGKIAGWLKESKYVPWILEKQATPQQAKICLA